MATKHTAAHPGFNKVASRIASRQHVSVQTADKELASSTRHAGKAARKANPRLNRVPRKK